MPHRILVIDDDKAIRLGLEDYFTQHGYHVDCAGTWEEAEALLAAFSYPAVITDLYFTDTQRGDGLAIVDYAHARSPRTRTILITAHGNPAIARQAQEHGVDVFLQKPFPLGVLLQHLAALL